MTDSPKSDVLYFQAHGLMEIAPETLNKALALAIDQMHMCLYSDSVTDLTTAEASVLQAGGFDLKESANNDPLPGNLDKNQIRIG